MTLKKQDEKYSQYMLEKVLANKLKSTIDKLQRRQLYGKVYTELYNKVPNLNTRSSTKTNSERMKKIIRRYSLINDFLSIDSIFLEIGSGSCDLIFYLAQFVERCYAVEVSNSRINTSEQPENCHINYM